MIYLVVLMNFILRIELFMIFLNNNDLFRSFNEFYFTNFIIY